MNYAGLSSKAEPGEMQVHLVYSPYLSNKFSL